MRIMESEYITEAETKRLLEAEIKGEPTYNEGLVIKHASAVKPASQKDKEIIKKISEIVPPFVAIKIVDVMPTDIETVKRILESYDIDMANAENIMKILEEK